MIFARKISLKCSRELRCNLGNTCRVQYLRLSHKPSSTQTNLLQPTRMASGKWEDSLMSGTWTWTNISCQLGRHVWTSQCPSGWTSTRTPAACASQEIHGCSETNTIRLSMFWRGCCTGCRSLKARTCRVNGHQNNFLTWVKLPVYSCDWQNYCGTLPSLLSLTLGSTSWK